MITTLKSLFGAVRAAVRWAGRHAIAAAHRAKLAARRAAAVVTERIRRWHEQHGSDEAVAARTARRSARSAARRRFWHRAGDAAKWFRPQPVPEGRQSAVPQAVVATGSTSADRLASVGCGERKTVLVAWKGGNRNGYHEVELICAGEPDKDGNCEHSAWRAVFCPCGQWLDRPWDGPCAHMVEAERIA